VSARVKDYLLKRSPQAAAKIYVVPNGVDTSIFAPARDKAEVRRELGIDPSTALIIFVGELLPWQQLQVLLEAMADVLVHRPETELVLLGQGIVERELKATAHDLGISGRARFMGRLLQKDVARWLAASDVAVYLPAAQRGASPLKVYEYLACGLPVVAARTAEIAAQFGDQLQYCESANRQDVSRALLRALGPSTQPSSSPIASSPIVRSWETVAGELLPIVRAAADGAQP
jgi:glycosyltransferase involved in cell wall biosynthesis